MKYKITMCFEFDNTKPLSQQNNNVIRGLIHSACPLCVGLPDTGCYCRNCIDCWSKAFEMVCDRGVRDYAAENVHVERLG